MSDLEMEGDCGSEYEEAEEEYDDAYNYVYEDDEIEAEAETIREASAKLQRLTS